jgi:hypothetical protein
MVLHRFSSPRWWEYILRHVSAEISTEAYDKLVSLQVSERNSCDSCLTMPKTGEAIVLSPSGLTMLDNGTALGRFGRLYIVMKTRKRVTLDGGTSVLVVNPSKQVM